MDNVVTPQVEDVEFEGLSKEERETIFKDSDSFADFANAFEGNEPETETQIKKAGEPETGTRSVTTEIDEDTKKTLHRFQNDPSKLAKSYREMEKEYSRIKDEQNNRKPDQSTPQKSYEPVKPGTLQIQPKEEEMLKDLAVKENLRDEEVQNAVNTWRGKDEEGNQVFLKQYPKTKEEWDSLFKIDWGFANFLKSKENQQRQSILQGFEVVQTLINNAPKVENEIAQKDYNEFVSYLKENGLNTESDAFKNKMEEDVKEFEKLKSDERYWYKPNPLVDVLLPREGMLNLFLHQRNRKHINEAIVQVAQARTKQLVQKTIEERHEKQTTFAPSIRKSIGSKGKTTTELPTPEDWHNEEFQDRLSRDQRDLYGRMIEDLSDPDLKRAYKRGY